MLEFPLINAVRLIALDHAGTELSMYSINTVNIAVCLEGEVHRSDELYMTAF